MIFMALQQPFWSLSRQKKILLRNVSKAHVWLTALQLVTIFTVTIDLYQHLELELMSNVSFGPTTVKKQKIKLLHLLEEE